MNNMLKNVISCTLRIWFICALLIQSSSLLSINIEMYDINYNILESMHQKIERRFESIPKEKEYLNNYYLVLWLRDGEQIYFPFENKPRMTFDEGVITIGTSNSEVSYSHTDVSKFTLICRHEQTDESDINNTSTAQAHIGVHENCIDFMNCPAGERVKVYAVSGRLHSQYMIDNTGKLSILFSQFPKGIYIIKMKDLTYKFSKK